MLRTLHNPSKGCRLYSVPSLSKYPEWLEFGAAGFLLGPVIDLRPVPVNIQDIFLSIANHSVLLEMGFIDKRGFLKTLNIYSRRNPEIRLLPGVIDKVMEFLRSMPSDQIIELHNRLLQLVWASGTDNRINEFLSERH